jgi:MoxR-like ATPase
MTVKLTENGVECLVEALSVKQIFKVDTDTDIILNTATKDVRLVNIDDLDNLDKFEVTAEWDRSHTKRYKKSIMEFLGDERLRRYAETDLVYETLSKKFVNVRAVSDLFKQSISTNMNMIMFGRGGFGKSEMCDELFNVPELRDRVFIKSLSEATTEEDLFGGVNIKKMTDTGVIEYNVEDSFANSEIVIFEEIFDANPRVLAALKDTLTAKEVRNGKQRFKIKTKLIIGLTNKSYDEVITDDSIEALTQRFPISYNLQYDLQKIDVFGLVLNRYPGIPNNRINAILELFKDRKVIEVLSPRKILEIAKYIKDLNVKKDCVYNEKITNIKLEPIITYLQNKRTDSLEMSMIDSISWADQQIKGERIYDINTIVDTAQKIKLIKKRNLLSAKSEVVETACENILNTIKTKLDDSRK